MDFYIRFSILLFLTRFTSTLCQITPLVLDVGRETLPNSSIPYSYINVTIGTPPQNLKMGLYISSGDIMVLDSSATECNGSSPIPACSWGTYQANKSQTYSSLNRTFNNMTYVRSDFAVSDVVTVGNKPFEDMTIVIDHYYSTHRFGIGGYIAQEGVNPPYPSIPLQLYQDGSNAITGYSIYLPRNNDTTPGRVIFGGVETTKFIGTLDTFQIALDSHSFSYGNITVILSNMSISNGIASKSINDFNNVKVVLGSLSFGAALALIAATVGSSLTVIGSGLYTVENTAVSSDVNVMAVTSFVPTFNISTDGGATSAFNLIEQNNASYPALTYDELVFPSIDLASLGTNAQSQLNKSETVTFHAKLPAMRASLNCTLVSQDAMVAEQVINFRDYSCPSTTVTFNVSLPESCPTFLDDKNRSVTEIELSWNFQFLCSHPSLLPPARLATIYSTYGDYSRPQATYLGSASNPSSCPSLAFMSGYFFVNDTSTANITAMTCIQGLEEVDSEATFQTSGESIFVASAPVPDESTTRWLTAFNSTYWFWNGISAGFDSFNIDRINPDRFYQAVTSGPGAIPADELAGPANAERFINATQHMYRRFMAQLISETMRQNLSAEEIASRPTYPGTVIGLPGQRITQDATSTLVLQICLSVMLVCGVLVYTLHDMRHVLPHSPWSIAGLMSLFAGAEMIERKVIPPGAEFMNDKDLAKVFDGYVFSMGWWKMDTGHEQDGEKPPMRFGIDIGNADVNVARRRRWHKR